MNKFLVSRKGEDIIILRPIRVLSQLDALNLAAWIVALCDDDEESSAFLELLRAVKDS